MLCEDCDRAKNFSYDSDGKPQNIGLRRSGRPRKPTPKDHQNFIYEQSIEEKLIQNQEVEQEQAYKYISIQKLLDKLEDNKLRIERISRDIISKEQQNIG